MSELARLEVTTRSGRGKGNARRLRMRNFVPGVYYDSKGENIPITADEMALRKIYASQGTFGVFNLDITGEDNSKKSLPVLIWSYIMHPVRNRLQHVDFYGVDLEKELTVRVKIETTGKPKGVVVGGKLEVYRDFIEVMCLPLNIPKIISIDVTDMDINTSLQIEDLTFPPGVRPIYDDNFAVLAVVSSLAEEDSEETEEEE